MGKVLKKVAPIALPILGTMIPGVGPVLGGALGGAAGGAIGGGGLKGILSGAALGGAGGYLSGGAGGLLGNAAGAPLSQVTGNAALQGPTMGSGIKGILSGGLSNAGRIVSNGLTSLTSGGGGGSSLANIARIGGSLYGASQEDEAAKKARNAMLGAVQPYNEMGLQAQTQLSNNLSSGFNPGDLTSDPSYQFRLKQGQDALNATLAAQGMGQSGAAMKAAQDYGQQFASTEYGNAYDRWLQQNNQLAGLGSQGLETASATGNTLGGYQLQQAEAKNRRIAEILQGLGLNA